VFILKELYFARILRFLTLFPDDEPDSILFTITVSWKQKMREQSSRTPDACLPI